MNEIFSRRVAKVLPEQKSLEELMNSQKIRVYLGIDPTGGQLHIGHAVGIRKLMEFAEAGHEVILLFGTGTVMVGDPSLRDSQRKVVSQKDIEQNIKTWQDQVKPVVDFEKVSIMQNGDWINKLTIKDFIDIASHISAVQLFKRESFTRRLDKGDTVWYHETMYPLLQGYDSVVMDVDLEIGGTDQEFNMLMGRELQKKMKNREKYVLTTPMIKGTDGQQMSKTSGNCVWLQDSPQEMFGKLMSIADEQIMPYFELCTDLDKDYLQDWKQGLETGSHSPREAKEVMAFEITKIWHSPQLASAARNSWNAQFQKGAIPKDIESLQLDLGKWQLSELLVKSNLASSKSEARRLIEQGGVRLNQQKVDGPEIEIKSGDILQAGKRRFIKFS